MSFDDDCREPEEDSDVTNPEPAPEATLMPLRLPPGALAQLRQHAHSRWAARIFVFGEDRYSESENPFTPGQPLVVRTPSSIGPRLAETCHGVQVLQIERPDGLQTGDAFIRRPDGTRETVYPTVGFIETAVADEVGITAMVAILDHRAHELLAALDADGELGTAMVCLQQRARAIVRRTRWALPVADVVEAAARSLHFTSLSHQRGARFLRRLAMDEKLAASDFTPAARVYVLGSLASDDAAPREATVSMGTVTTPELGNTSVTTPKRQAQGSQSFFYNLAGNQKATPPRSATASGAIPSATFDSGNSNGDFAVWLTNLTTTQLTLCGLNISGSPISGTATVYFW